MACMRNTQSEWCGVVLVGAGCGDASLATVAAVEWLSMAEVVVYDRLANPRLLAHVPANAERIYVGKRPGDHTRTQEQINELLVELGQAGKRVVRLKGGDPFVFGRGGEEAAALAAAGVPFRVVPGITAGIAAAAFAGIPVTDRSCASAVALVTGHEDPTKDETSLDYDALTRLDTVVLYMGVGRLGKIAAEFVAAGRAADTPVAVIADGTLPSQRTVTGTLATIADAVAEEGISPPAVIVIGPVVRLREQLAWFEKLPLAGQTVLVTRTRKQASALSQRLERLGAAVLEAPCLDIQPPESFAPLDAALDALDDFDWLVFTSPNGVGAVVDRAVERQIDARRLAGVKIAAVGSGTAEELTRAFLRPDLLPDTFTTAALGEALVAEGMQDQRVLLARADIATDTLPEILRAAGADVAEVTAYRTLQPDSLGAEADAALLAGAVDWVTFASSSTVENFLAIAPGGWQYPETPSRAARPRLAAIGPVTATTLADHGLAADVVAAPHTIASLVEAIVSAGK